MAKEISNEQRLDRNYEFIKNIDDEFIEEFVNVPSGIPILLMNILEKVDPNIGLKRMLVYEKHPEYEVLDRIERVNAKKLLENNKLDESQEYHIKFALNFLEKYPKFKLSIFSQPKNIYTMKNKYNSME